MGVAAQYLGIPFSSASKALYENEGAECRAVCVVSKRYRRGQQDRYWFGIRPAQLEFLKSARQAFFVFGCGGSDLTVLIPSEEFLPRLSGMRKTEEGGGRGYWHAELFGNADRLELGLSVTDGRLDVTKHIVGHGAPVKETGA